MFSHLHLPCLPFHQHPSSSYLTAASLHLSTHLQPALSPSLPTASINFIPLVHFPFQQHPLFISPSPEHPSSLTSISFPSISHPFLGDYVRLRQNGQWKKLAAETNDQYVVFADIVNKITRSAGKVWG